MANVTMLSSGLQQTFQTDVRMQGQGPEAKSLPREILLHAENNDKEPPDKLLPRLWTRQGVCRARIVSPRRADAQPSSRQ